MPVPRFDASPIHALPGSRRLTLCGFVYKCTCRYPLLAWYAQTAGCYRQLPLWLLCSGDGIGVERCWVFGVADQHHMDLR